MEVILEIIKKLLEKNPLNVISQIKVYMRYNITNYLRHIIKKVG